MIMVFTYKNARKGREEMRKEKRFFLSFISSLVGSCEREKEYFSDACYE